jgi:hypothetical protein
MLGSRRCWTGSGAAATCIGDVPVDTDANITLCTLLFSTLVGPGGQRGYECRPIERDGRPGNLAQRVT